MVVSKFEG